jgi:drug/metabolite transporter (DMT)-like permease
LSIALGQAVVGLALTVGLAIVIERPGLVAPPPEALAAAAYLGIASSGIAALIFFRLIATWGAGRTTLVNYLIPVVGVVLGAVVLGERLDATTLTGGALVIAGVAVAGRRGGGFAPARPAVWSSRAIERSPA